MMARRCCRGVIGIASSIMMLLMVCSGQLLSVRPCLAEVLKGGIEHLERLNPLPAGLQKGSVYSAPSAVRTVAWFPIPDWLAGKWEKKGDLETFAEDFRSGRTSNQKVWLGNVVTLTFGHQRDALGTIWDAEVLPFRADGERGIIEDRRYVTDMACERTRPEVVILRFLSVVTMVDRRNGRIVESKQQDEIITFTPQDANTIDSSSSSKSFDQAGRPLFRFDTHTRRRRVAEFIPIPYVHGVDMRASLAQFLAAHNMQNRIPRAVGQ